MKKTIAGAGCLLLFAFAAAASDDPTRVLSHPTSPSREALDRLNLQMAWAVHIPMDGLRDGFASIQTDGNQVIVQTRSGLVALLDAENGGRSIWQARAGRAYQAALPPAFNGRSIFTSDSGNIYGINRRTGALEWTYALRVSLSAPLSADDEKIFVNNIEARLIAFHLPGSAPPKAPTHLSGDDNKSDGEGGTVSTSTLLKPALDKDPIITWDYDTNQRIENKAVLSKDTIFMAVPGGSYLGVPKTGAGVELGNQELYRFAGDSRYSAPVGHSETLAYLGTEDAHLYAVNVNTGKVMWRYISGRPVTRRPVVVDVTDGAAVDRDLYVTADGKGMARLSAQTGEPLWSIRRRDFNPECDRFLATNPKFVYASDGGGRLLVLDRKNGATLSSYDVRDFVYTVVNDQTDRLYLAANDGLIVCLHDKEYGEALNYNKPFVPPPTKPLAARIQELNDKLLKPISEPGSADKIPFKTYRDKIAQDFGLKIYVSGKAFADQKVPDPDEQLIQPPKVDNKPLGNFLKDLLETYNADYTVVEDSIVIGPAKAK